MPQQNAGYRAVSGFVVNTGTRLPVRPILLPLNYCSYTQRFSRLIGILQYIYVKARYRTKNSPRFSEQRSHFHISPRV